MKTIWGAFVVLSLLAGAGCTSSGDGSSIGERIILAGPTPPEMAEEEADVHCPSVDVISGGSVIQNGGGEGTSPRSVITLGQLARECRGQRDGSTVVKVGVEGRAVLGGGGPSRFDVPVQIVVKSRGNVLTSRVLRASIAVPAGSSHGSFALVQEGLVVPPGASGDFEIEVGLGGAAGRRG